MTTICVSLHPLVPQIAKIAHKLVAKPVFQDILSIKTSNVNFLVNLLALVV